MNNRQEVSKRESGELEHKQEAPAMVTVPPVDVFEDPEGITLQLDMPGVTKDRLKLEANRQALVIEGEAFIDMPQGMQALYADVRSTHYRRSFVLSDELETDKTEATIKDGVLTVRIPKRSEMRPRRIEVQTG
jgi:HSP20 family molecular chaperone IbpA